ncbi:MAG: hypothetical protein WBA74_22725 [Cyclobacteriaceae bacterium]
MKRTRLVPLITFRRERLSIVQIAEQVTNFYKKLALVDNNHSQIYIVSEKKSKFQKIDINDDYASRHLAEEILHQNIDEISKMDKVKIPQLDFLFVKSIISFGLETKAQDESLLTFHFSFLDSDNLKSSISNIVTNPNCFNTFEKAKLFLYTAEKSFGVDYSVIKISERDINKVARGFKAPLGLITYFSNDYEIPIPDDLEGIEYEHTDKGKYLILTRENVAEDEAKLEKAKQKLLKTMQEIADKVPEYIK